MNPPPSIALIVHACDRYKFLYRGFEYFFSQYWNFEINCNYYFATEEIDAEVARFTNIKSGKGPWSDRLATLLRNQISEDYVLYFQEDMWLDQAVSKSFFNQLFLLAKQQNWKQIKLHSADIYTTCQAEHFIDGFNISRLDNAKSRYLMSHQVTLWDRQFLMAQLFQNEDPWRNERRGTKRLMKIDPAIYHVDYFAQGGAASINANHNFIKRSSYYTISLNGLLNDDVLRFIAKLGSGDHHAREYAQELQHHFDNNLTHDGNERPRKQDFVKRLKNWLLKK